jgi:hypothetical protein
MKQCITERATHVIQDFESVSWIIWNGVKLADGTSASLYDFVSFDGSQVSGQVIGVYQYSPALIMSSAKTGALSHRTVIFMQPTQTNVIIDDDGNHTFSLLRTITMIHADKVVLNSVSARHFCGRSTGVDRCAVSQDGTSIEHKEASNIFILNSFEFSS